MSIIDLEIGCDWDLKPPCGSKITLTGAKSIESAVQMLSTAGWKHRTKSGHDYCPSCLKLLLLDDLGPVESNIDPTSTE